MVNHNFICACGHGQEALVGYPPEADAPVHCGKPMELDWMALPQGVQEFQAFTTRHIDPNGKPIHIGGKGDLEWAYREYGVRRDYDDPDLEAVGSEIRKKTPKMGKVFDMGGRR